MNGPRVVRSAQAEEDLIGIWVRIALDDQASADRLLDRIDEACSRLAEFPEMGIARDDVRPGLRTFPVRGYLILYRVVAHGIEIVRVLHGARQWQELL
ncbi:MAG TPA: type II toxin-antitoxin system RelE/ParE family toxin [Microvirga sp.]|nr:type II toxin-antitoxin system RelE/ParE family toxin [Microvirga sp.]